MRILAIDQSYRSCGIVVFEDGDMIHYEKFVTNKDDDIYDRADQLASHIKELTLKYNPDVVALEGLSFGSVGNVTRDLGGLLFLIVVTLRKVGKEVIIIPPNTVKKKATGKGNAKKNLVMEALPDDIREKFLKLGVKKTTGLGDLADAYWIGKCVEDMLK